MVQPGYCDVPSVDDDIETVMCSGNASDADLTDELSIPYINAAGYLAGYICCRLNRMHVKKKKTCI